MSQVVIENPVINSPFREPTRHFRFTDEGITNEIESGRRISSYFAPIAQPRKKGSKQLLFDIEWTQDRSLAHPEKLANPQDARFSDTFFVVTPGITIRDRLRVLLLLPNDPQNYYRQRDILPAQLMEQLGQAKILITNFHAFLLREKVAAGKITKAILAKGEKSTFTETPDQMVRRFCRELGNKKNIVVLNDEVHHCYRRKPDVEDEKLTGDDRIEAGIVKVPRVPVVEIQ